jgi:hypothetical protein
LCAGDAGDWVSILKKRRGWANKDAQSTTMRGDWRMAHRFVARCLDAADTSLSRRSPFGTQNSAASMLAMLLLCWRGNVSVHMKSSSRGNSPKVVTLRAALRAYQQKLLQTIGQHASLQVHNLIGTLTHGAERKAAE